MHQPAKHKYCRPRNPPTSQASNTHAFFPTLLESLKFILVKRLAHRIYFYLLRQRYAVISGVRTYCYVLFALMQKVPKKSRPKDASTHMPTHHLAFGPGQQRTGVT
jgi:hypothetical protein